MTEIERLRQDNKALMRMLLRRVTWLDRLRAWRKPGHWYNQFQRELLIP